MDYLNHPKWHRDNDARKRCAVQSQLRYKEYSSLNEAATLGRLKLNQCVEPWT